MRFMKMEDFLTDLADLLDVEVSELNSSYQLDENENWDSLTMISVIVMVDEHFNLSLSNEALRKCKFIGDLFCLVEGNEEKATV